MSKNKSTLEDIDRIIKNYIKPNDKFAKDIVKVGGVDDLDASRGLIVKRIAEESGQDFEESLRNLFYDSNLRVAISIIIKDNFDEMSDTQEKLKVDIPKIKIRRRDGTFYFRRKAMKFNKQEDLFFRLRMRRHYSPEEMEDAYKEFFGDEFRTSHSIKSKYYNVRKAKYKKSLREIKWKKK